MIKKSALFVGLILCVVVFVAFTAQNASSLVKGSLHDLTAATGGGQFLYTGTSNPCVFCHTPHHANSTSGGKTYLWNKALPSQAFLTYTSDTLKTPLGAPGTMSLLCLSCHDGIGAFNVLLFNYTGNTISPFGAHANRFGDYALGDPQIGPLNIGSAQCTGPTCTGGDDLRDDHPIGVNYDTAYTDDNAGLKIFASLPLPVQARLNLSGKRMECTTCHDPHITNTTLTRNNFLVLATSSLCTGCHIK